MGGFLGAAGLHGNVPGKVTAVGEGLEGPDSGGDHAQPAAHEHIPVAHAALLHRVGLDVGHQHTVYQDCSGLQVLRGVDSEFRLIFIEQCAAVLGHYLEELVIGDGLPDAEDIVAQGTDLLRSVLHVVLGPVGGGVVHTGLVKEVLIVDEDHVGEAFRQAVLLAVHIEGIQRGIVEAADIHAGDLRQHPLVGVGGEVLDVQLVAVGSSATGHPGLHLSEVVVVADSLYFHLDVGILGLKGFHHLG